MYKLVLCPVGDHMLRFTYLLPHLNKNPMIKLFQSTSHHWGPTKGCRTVLAGLWRTLGAWVICRWTKIQLSSWHLWMVKEISQNSWWLDGGFEYILFSPLWEMIQFESYYSTGLVQPPTRWIHSREVTYPLPAGTFEEPFLQGGIC